MPDRSTTQFSTWARPRIYYVEENEGSLVVDVMRLGSMKGTVKVRYHTEPCTEGEGISDQDHSVADVLSMSRTSINNKDVCT